jgi:hypothetical protein
MPIYEVQDAQGRTLELEGDREPTAEELTAVFAEAFPAAEPATPAKTLADFMAEPSTQPDVSSPVTAGVLETSPAADAKLPSPEADAELLKQEGLTAVRQEPPAPESQITLPKPADDSTFVGGVLTRAAELGEGILNNPAYAVGALHPATAAAEAIYFTAEGTKQVFKDVVQGAKTGDAGEFGKAAVTALATALPVIHAARRAQKTAPATAEALEASAEVLTRQPETKPVEAATEPATPVAEPAPQPLGIVSPGSQILDAIIPRQPDAPPPIELKPGERLPQPRPFAEAKKIFAQPYGMGKLPVIGVIADTNARVRTPVQESVNTYYANRYGVGPAIASALGEEIKGTIDPAFAIDPKTSRITNITPNREGLSLHVSDVLETLQREPDSYTLTPEQKAAWQRIEGVLNEVKDLQKKEGLSSRLDEEVSADPILVDVEPLDAGSAYFPRIVTKRPKESKGPVGPRAGSVGAKQFFQKSRMFETEAEGVSRGYVYEPSIEKRLTTLVDRTYKAIFDKQLAEDPTLGGRTRKQVKQELEVALADKLEAGEITPERLDAIVDSKAAKGRVWEPGLMKYIFEPEVAEVLNRSLPKQSGELGRAYMTVNNAARELTLSGDFSAALIQLLPTLYRNPVIWGRSVANGFKAVVEPSTFDAYVKRNLESVRELAQLGTSVGQLEQLMSGAPGRSVLERTPGIRKAFAPFQRNFQTTLDVAKIELWKAWKQVTPPEQRLEVARTIESQLGTSRIESAGIKHTQAFAERALLLANSYYRGSLNYIALLGQKGVSGKMARQGLGSLLAGGAATYVAIAYALGMNEDKIQERLNPANGNFLMWPIKLGDRVTEVGLGSFYRSMLRLAGNLEKTAIQHPEHFLSLAPDKNPFTRWWRGHASLPIGVAWDQFTGQDYLGRDSSIADIVPSLTTPLAAESGREYISSKVRGEETDVTLGQVAVDTLASFVGASAYQESRRNQLMRVLEERSQTSYGKPYGELPIGQQRNIAEQVQKLTTFQDKKEPNKREREMAFQADIDRVIRIRESLPAETVKRLDDLNVKMRGYDPALTLGKVKVPLTRRQVEAYEGFVKEEYARLIPNVLPAMEKAESQAVRQQMLDKVLDGARAAAKARLMTANKAK